MSAFASIISDSAPHIYISALVFAPSESIIKLQYSTEYRNILHVQTGMRAHWPPCELVIGEHTESVESVAFSPDGERIVSGSHDNTARIWDSRTGKLLAGPFELAVDRYRVFAIAGINSVAFSPDGERVASGSSQRPGGIDIWDARTGEHITIRLDDFINGYDIDVSVLSVAFSPDGERIASGLSNGTVCIWDSHTGKLFLPPFLRHTGLVNSVMFSPDGEHLVSGFDDGTIRVWNSRTGEIVGKPLQIETRRRPTGEPT